MFQAFSNTSTTYTANAPIAFPTIKYDDCRVRVTNGTSFRISAPGRYVIAFNGVGAATTATTAFSLQLYKDGVAQPETLTTITSVAENDAGSLGFTTIVNVLPSCNCVNNTVTLQVIATAGVVSTANIVIYRVKQGVAAMMKIIDELKERIVDELEELNDKEKWYPVCVEAMYYMIKTWKYLCEIEEKEKLPPPSTK